jgi:anti-sigma-K factor RskA
MNTFEADKDNLRYAEYVLGLLDADARAAVAREVDNSPEAAAAVGLWQRHLTPLALEIADEAPPAHVWAAIRRRLGLDAATRRPPERAWDSVALWRWLGIGATAVAACLLVLTLTRMGVPAPPVAEHAATPATLMVATIASDRGVAGWTATMDIERSELLLVPATPEGVTAVPADRSTELWLIPQGGKPISVGVFSPADPKRIHLDKALLDQLGPTAALAVSVEPSGGSPTGQPTGPVVAKGAIRAA